MCKDGGGCHVQGWWRLPSAGMAEVDIRAYLLFISGYDDSVCTETSFSLTMLAILRMTVTLTQYLVDPA